MTNNIWFLHRESNPGRLEFTVFSSVKQRLNWNFQEQVRRAWSLYQICYTDFHFNSSKMLVLQCKRLRSVQKWRVVFL